MNPLFHEIYGQYFQIIEEIYSEPQRSKQEIQQIISAKGYGETLFSLLPNLLGEEENWHLFYEEPKDVYRSIQQKKTKRPYTLLEKRWLKTILQDQRMLLFLTEEKKQDVEKKLADVEVLFTEKDIDYFDQFYSEDDFQSAIYQNNFQQLLKGIQKKLLVSITYQAVGKKEATQHLIAPLTLEYSQKNDKFRLKGYRQNQSGSWKELILNLSEVQQALLLEKRFPEDFKEKNNEKEIICLLQNDRDTLERAMFHFSNYRKVTKKTEKENEYELKIYYQSQDETELLINVLSFGPFLTVQQPPAFIKQIRYRLNKQKELFYPKAYLKEENSTQNG